MRKIKVALVTSASCQRKPQKTDGLTLDYKDEAAAKKPSSRMRKPAYLIDEKDGQLGGHLCGRDQL